MTGSQVYLDHATAAPLASRVDEALREAAADASRARHEALAAECERARDRIALLLGADPGEIAFVPHATAGLADVARDVDWQPGDRMALVGDPRAWRALRVRGVDPLVVPLEAGALPPGALEAALRHPRVRLLAVASVDAATGARAPVSAIARLCREHGVRLCVEASLAAGCLELDLTRDAVDDLVADGHRWLLGLSGTGVRFRRRRGLRDTRPPRETAEVGPRNELGIAALGAAADLLLETGPAEIETRVLALTEHLAKGLASIGMPTSSPRARLASGLVDFRAGDEAPAVTAARLAERGIRVGAKAHTVRVSPHFYNDEGEIDALLAALAR